MPPFPATSAAAPSPAGTRRAGSCGRRGFGPGASPNAGKLAGVQGVWAAHCQLVGDGGRRVLFAGLGEGGGSFTLAWLGARAPGEERLAPDLVEDVVQQSPAGGP